MALARGIVLPRFDLLSKQTAQIRRRPPRRGLQLYGSCNSGIHYPSRCDESNGCRLRGTDSALWLVVTGRGRQIVVTWRGLTALRSSNIFRHVNPRAGDHAVCDTYVYTHRDFCSNKHNTIRQLKVRLYICNNETFCLWESSLFSNYQTSTIVLVNAFVNFIT